MNPDEKKNQFTIYGTVVKVSEVLHTFKNQIPRQEIQVKLDGRVERFMSFNVWGDLIETVQPGDTIKAFINIEGRMHPTKTQHMINVISAWKIFIMDHNGFGTPAGILNSNQ